MSVFVGVGHRQIASEMTARVKPTPDRNLAGGGVPVGLKVLIIRGLMPPAKIAIDDQLFNLAVISNGCRVGCHLACRFVGADRSGNQIVAQLLILGDTDINFYPTIAAIAGEETDSGLVNRVIIMNSAIIGNNRNFIGTTQKNKAENARNGNNQNLSHFTSSSLVRLVVSLVKVALFI